MQVRIDECQGNSAAFDLVLIDGLKDGEFPTCVQIEDSHEQIGLAISLGCPFVDENDQPMPHPEGRHGIAYDFLSDHAKARTIFTLSEGYFAMWNSKRFKSRDEMLAWIKRHEGLIQYNEIFIENGYAIEWRRLRIVG